MLIIAPLFSNQWIIGIIVNFALFHVALTRGLFYSLPLAILPPISAYLIGFLPQALLPIVACIILANILLVFTFQRFSHSLYGMILASCLKFIFLFTSFSLLALYFVQMGPFVAMFGATQLLTALLGGFFAMLKKKAANRN